MAYEQVMRCSIFFAVEMCDEASGLQARVRTCQLVRTFEQRTRRAGRLGTKLHTGSKEKDSQKRKRWLSSAECQAMQLCLAELSESDTFNAKHPLLHDPCKAMLPHVPRVDYSVVSPLTRFAERKILRCALHSAEDQRSSRARDSPTQKQPPSPKHEARHRPQRSAPTTANG